MPIPGAILFARSSRGEEIQWLLKSVACFGCCWVRGEVCARLGYEWGGEVGELSVRFMLSIPSFLSQRARIPNLACLLTGWWGCPITGCPWKAGLSPAGEARGWQPVCVERQGVARAGTAMGLWMGSGLAVQEMLGKKEEASSLQPIQRMYRVRLHGLAVDNHQCIFQHPYPHPVPR
jgi:hypothetical protein